MDLSGRVATWLDLALAPSWHKDDTVIRIHSVGTGQTDRFAFSVDGRWLCAGGRRLTLFHGLAAAEHFLELLRVEGFERGEPISEASASDVPRYCLSLHAGSGLIGCASQFCVATSESRNDAVTSPCAALQAGPRFGRERPPSGRRANSREECAHLLACKGPRFTAGPHPV